MNNFQVNEKHFVVSTISLSDSLTHSMWRRVDYFSQLDDDDNFSLTSGRSQASSINNNNHLMNSLNNNSSNSSSRNSANSISLKPVITKKTMSNDGSANSFNNRRKLPVQPPAKLRSTPLTPEKVSFDAKISHSASASTSPTKRMQSMSLNSSSSSRSSANSIKSSVSNR